MHKILERQLKRFQVDSASPPNIDKWKELLLHIDRAYHQADQDRYLLERSLAISSKETQELYDVERRRAEEALRVSEGKYRNLFEHAIDSIFIIDAATRQILDVNQVAAERLGYTRAELLNLVIDDLNPPAETANNAELIQNILNAGSLTFERTHIRKDGTRIPVEVSTSVLEYDGKKVFQSIVRDITERKKAEKELKRMATHDSLTGLSNRILFDDRLSHAIDIVKRNKEILAVLYLDLDGFKEVNDAFGHKQGDRLLQTISKRLLDSVRRSDTVARIGGDEFAVLVEGIKHERDVLPIAQKIIKAVAEPFMFQDAEAFITSSVGISLFPTDSEDPDTLIQNADRAMYLSKAEGKNDYRFFTSVMKTQALERLELGNQLREAIEQQEILIFYQPQINSRVGRITGVEALVRWRHPEFGLLLPDRFIHLAEEMGLIVPLSDWILQTACEQVNTWFANGVPHIRLAVNLSDRDLNQPDLVKKIKGLLNQTRFPPHLLELELSENIIFRNLEKTQDVLERLKDLGVRLAIDDFGVGYSTLSQMARFPFDTLKIDRQFASQIKSSPSIAAIVNGIVTIAKNLGMEIVAEGVEDDSQLNFYENLGCYQIQGWLFHKAESADEIETLLREGIPRSQFQLSLDLPYKRDV